MKSPKKEPSAIAIVWDASSSAKNRDIDKEIQLLESYLKGFEKLDVGMTCIAPKIKYKKKGVINYAPTLSRFISI